jgi:hypothetical protein
MAEQQAATPPDTTVTVTGETMQAYTEAKLSGGEFKPEAAPKAAPQAPAEEGDIDAPEPPVAEAAEEPGEPKKELSAKQVKANERWKAHEKARIDAEAKADAAVREAAALRAKYEPPVQAPEVEPDPVKYTDAKKYAEDYFNWKEGARVKAETAARAQTAAQAVQDRFNKSREEFKKTHADWDERAKAKSGAQMHNEVISAIMESDFPVEIMYDLTPEEITRINNMPNMRDRLRAIGKMEAKYAKAAEPAKEPVKAAAPVVDELDTEAEVSAAPPPIKPLNGKSAGADALEDKDGNFVGNQEQFEKWYKKKYGTVH